MKKDLLLSLLFGILLVGCRAMVQAPSPASSCETLAIHETLSTFQGITQKTCMGRTTRCPDSCGNSGLFASFKIEDYLSFESHSEHSKKQTHYRVQLEDNHQTHLVSEELYQTLSSLSPAEKVHLTWKHDYISDNGASYPKRTVTLLKKISPQ
jgi:hypothetical protein